MGLRQASVNSEIQRVFNSLLFDGISDGGEYDQVETSEINWLFAKEMMEWEWAPAPNLQFELA